MNARARPVVVLIDDEERILRSLAMLFRAHFRVLATTDPHVALEAVQRERVHVIVSDQRMPQMLGAELLRQVRLASPRTLRILLTGYSELDAVIASANEGEIFRFVNKPWDSRELLATVQQAAAIAERLHAEAAQSPASSADGAAILVIDQDPAVAAAVRELSPADRRVLQASSIDGALQQLAAAPIGVVVAELQVSGQPLVPLLKQLKAEHPEVVTLVMTPFQDIGTLVGLINQGQVFRFLPKPMRRNLLSMSLHAAFERHAALLAAPALRAAHRVEPMREAAELSVASRISGFLARLRGRLAPGLENTSV